MITILKNIVLKSFWPLMAIYGVLLLYLMYKYFEAKSITTGKLINEQGYAIVMIPVGVLLVLALLSKVWRMDRIAHLILAVPAGLILGYFILMVIIWLFVAILFIIGGK